MRGTGGLRFASICIAVLASLWGGRVQADDALLSRVEATLTAGVEASSAHDAILVLGAAGRTALQQVFAKSAAPSHTRLRALSLLAELGDASTAQLFAQLVRDASMPPSQADPLHPARSPLVLRRALEGLLRLAPVHAPPLDTAELAQALSHHDAHVRKAAADLLAALSDEDAERVLVQRLEGERSTMVRERLQRALTSRLARRAARPVGPESGSRPR